MKTVLVYSSKTGFTEKYARWIAEEIKCEIIPYKSFDKDVVAKNDVIIFGSRLHAGKMEHLTKVKEMLAGSEKSLVLFACGATPAAATEVLNEFWESNLTEQERADIPHFYVQGGLDYDKMKFADRTLMKMFAKMLANKKDKTEQEAAMAKGITKSFDGTDKSCIMPIVECVKGMMVQIV